MFADIDLSKLADMKAPERAFLSVYIEGKHSLVNLEKRLRNVRYMMKGGTIEKDEREHL